MIDRLGGLYVSEHTVNKIVLRLTRPTNLMGLLIFLAGAVTALKMYEVWHLGAAVPGLVAIMGLMLFSLRRSVIVDREEGTVEVRQSILGLELRSAVPLFHLAAVVVSAERPGGVGPSGDVRRGRYVAFLRRRMGGIIYLDESPHCKALMDMAEAVAEVAEVRFEYDARRVQ